MIELADGATVTQTAHRCGWAAASAFVDTFTAAMGQTPGAYRSAATSAGLLAVSRRPGGRGPRRGTR
jgi:AraC-like DNA-binding protein